MKVATLGGEHSSLLCYGNLFVLKSTLATEISLSSSLLLHLLTASKVHTMSHFIFKASCGVFFQLL